MSQWLLLSVQSRLLAQDSNATRLPSELMRGSTLLPLPDGVCARETRKIAPVWLSRR